MEPNERIAGRVSPNNLNSGWVFFARGGWWMPMKNQPVVHGSNTEAGPTLEGFVVVARQVPEGHDPVPGPSGGWFVPDDNPTKMFIYGIEAKIKAFPPPPHPGTEGAE